MLYNIILMFLIGFGDIPSEGTFLHQTVVVDDPLIVAWVALLVTGDLALCHCVGLAR